MHLQIHCWLHWQEVAVVRPPRQQLPNQHLQEVAPGRRESCEVPLAAPAGVGALPAARMASGPEREGPRNGTGPPPRYATGGRGLARACSLGSRPSGLVLRVGVCSVVGRGCAWASRPVCCACMLGRCIVLMLQPCDVAGRRLVLGCRCLPSGRPPARRSRAAEPSRW